jgi:hypothetical protein
MNRLAWSVLTTIIFYLLISFVAWDILVIEQLPEASTIIRFSTILIFIGKECILSIIGKDLPRIVKPSNNKKNEFFKHRNSRRL